ncbi:MAG: tetratricopeptide repeat protein [Candidatus Thermoplasmatota archaeon]|jgi:tetratricopeptide (TPR) repeat protein|nr:tetratricopeptide repeat protein [Candidatus Thermoplasmatota archaeon]
MSQEQLPHRTKENHPFINRVREKGLLFEHLNSATFGKGGMVLLEGEAGIGKTRLVTEIIEVALEKGFHHIAGRCLEYRKTPIFPFIEMLKEHLRVQPGLSRKENMDAFLRTINEQHPALQDMIGPLFDLMVPMDEVHGSFKASIEDLPRVINDLKSRGFRTIMVSGTDLGEEIIGNCEPADRIVVDTDESKGVSPRRLERLAMRIRDLFTTVRHCALIDCSLGPLLLHNGPDKVERMLKVMDQLAAGNGGVCVHVPMVGSDHLSGTLAAYDLYERPLEDGKDTTSDKPMDEQKPLLSTYELVPSIFLELSKKDPLLIVLEDLQWGEKTTLNLLHYLARTARNERMLILGSYRPEGMDLEEGDHDTSRTPLREALRRISRERLFDIIQVARFDRSTTGLLMESILGRTPEQSLLEKVFKETEGNPRYIIERLRTSSTNNTRTAEVQVPFHDAAEDMFIKRVNALEPLAREVLELVSVIGRATRLEDIISMTGRGEGDILDAVDSMEQMRFLRETEDGFVFEHNKVRESVHSIIPPEKRALMHLRIADRLEKKKDLNDPDATARMAEHYYMGEQYRSSLELSLTSSERYIERSLLDQAQKELERALDCFERLDDTRDNWVVRINVIMSLGDIHQRRGELFKALNRYNEARDISESKSVTLGLSSAYRRIGDTLLRLFDWDQTADNYLRSLHLSKKSEDKNEVALTFKGLGRVYYLKGDYNRALDCYMRYLENPNGGKSSTYILALQEIGDIYNELGEFNQALTYYKLSIRTGEEKQLSKETALSLVRMSNVLMRVGDLDEARRFSDLAFSLIRDNLGDDVSEKALIGYIEMMIEFGDLECAEDGASLIPGGLQGAGSDRLIDAVKARINALLLARRRDFEVSHTEMERSMMVLQELQVPFQLALTYFHGGLIRFQCMEVEKAKDLLIKASEVFKTIKAIHYMSRTASKLREVTFIMEGMRR